MYDLLKAKTAIRLFAALVIICGSRSVLDARQLQSQRTNPQSEAISSILREVISKEGIPGIIAAITSSEGIVSIGSEGVRRINTKEQITNNDLIHIGSCTKAMTSLLIGTLVADNLIRWDTQLIKVFPELYEAIHPDFHSITVWQLLTHRSRVSANAKNWWKYSNLELKKRRIELLKENLKNAPMIEPGSYQYSNLGYMIAGCIAEKITDDTWENLIKKRIFVPLNMRSAGFGPPGTLGKIEQPWGHLRSGSNWQPKQSDNAQSLGPAGRVHCNVEDWAKFISLQLPKNQSRALYDHDILNKLKTPTDQYAGGWIVVKRSWGKGFVLTHSGSNTMWYTVVWVAPRLNRAFIVATNSKDENSRSICDKLIRKLIKIDNNNVNF